MLNSISLRNFKCFKQKSIPVGQLSLFTGLNSSGKSTVLQALLLLRQSSMQQSLPKRGMLLHGPLLNLGTSGGVLNTAAEDDKVEISTTTDQGAFQWTFSYRGPGDDMLPIISEPTNYEGISFLSAPFHYVSAERIGPRPIHEYSSYNIETLGQMGPDGRYAVAYLSARANEKVSPPLRHANAMDDTLFAQVTAWLGEISPGVRLKITPKQTDGTVQLMVGFIPALAAIDFFDPRNVGFGLSYSLPILVAALSLPPGGLMVIENPEAHLHSRGQIAMATLLALAARSGVQVLIETHSDHLLNGIRLAIKDELIAPEIVSVNFFRRHAEKVATYEIDNPRIDKNGRIDRWPTDFFDQWDKSLDRLLD